MSSGGGPVQPSAPYLSQPPQQDEQPPPSYTNSVHNVTLYDERQPLAPPQPLPLVHFVPTREQRFAALLNRYEIGADFAASLQKHLVNTKIVFVFDDSGSMNTVLADSPLVTTGGGVCTRWDELRHFATVSVDIANIFSTEGVDVHFLNRPPARAVKDMYDLEPYFATPPNGLTPLRAVLEMVLLENGRMRLGERKLLIVIVTDGEPSDQNGRPDIDGFRSALLGRDKHVHTTIVSCTDEDDTMDYLNNWDKSMPRLDVVDDYKNERMEIQKARGRYFPFSYGDYIVKILIGSLDPKLDRSDERGLGKSRFDCACFCFFVVFVSFLAVFSFILYLMIKPK